MDITMCNGLQLVPESNDSLLRVCKKREQCYRHMAPENELRQSWFVEAPLKFVNGEQQCEYFGPNEKE